MNRTRWLGSLLLVAVLAAAGGYWWAQRTVHPTAATTTAPVAAERQPLYWYDPMMPDQHFDQPGKSPFMDMQLVAKYADADAAAAAGVNIDAGVQQNLGIRLATVQRGIVTQPITVPGNLLFNQRDIAVVQSRTDGFVERVYQRAPGDVIEKGAPLVDLLVPQWAGAQGEYLALLAQGDAGLIAAARQRLVLLGMSPTLIDQLTAQRQVQPVLTITAPIGGVIDTLAVRAGMSISAGMTLAQINGLSSVWLEAQPPEIQSGMLQVGKSVNASLPAYPGENFSGKVIAILPEANLETRTVRLRVELPNPQRRLRPGMFAQLQLQGGDRQPVLFVPSPAVIRSGMRDVVIVVDAAQRFAPVEVQLGAASNEQTVIRSGVQEGQQVVVSGQFLIDSEASLQGVLARLNAGHHHD